MSGNYRALEQAARELLPDDNRAPEDGVRFSKSKNGKRKFSGSGDEHVLAALEQRLRDGLDTSRPAGPQMFSRLTKILEGDAGVQVPVPRPIVAVAAEQPSPQKYTIFQKPRLPSYAELEGQSFRNRHIFGRGVWLADKDCRMVAFVCYLQPLTRHEPSGWRRIGSSSFSIFACHRIHFQR